MTLPAIGAADQQRIKISLISQENEAKIFQFDPVSQRLTLKPNYEAQLVKGNLCPSFDSIGLEFQIESDVLGTSTKVIEVRTNIRQPDQVTTFEFSYDWEKALADQQQSESFKLPSFTIDEVSMSGQVNVVFSDRFSVRTNLTAIKT